MCCLQGPAPEEWIAAFASVREAALADEARSHTIDGNTGNALVPFDNLLSSEVWYHLMGAAHLNTFKLQYYSSSATLPEELPATGTAAGITEDETNKLKGSTERIMYVIMEKYVEGCGRQAFREFWRRSFGMRPGRWQRTWAGIL